jgi:hypothetical protein
MPSLWAYATRNWNDATLLCALMPAGQAKMGFFAFKIQWNIAAAVVTT